MKNKLDAIIGLLVLVIGLLVTFTPFQLAPVEKQLLELKSGSFTYMACHYTGKAEVVTGIAVIITGLVMLLTRKTGAPHGTGVIAALFGLVIIILPTSLGSGICRMPMACHTTQKVLWVWGALLVIAGAYSLWRLVQKPKQQRQDVSTKAGI